MTTYEAAFVVEPGSRSFSEALLRDLIANCGDPAVSSALRDLRYEVVDQAVCRLMTLAEEPEEWAVVEAACVHTPDNRRKWVRYGESWYPVQHHPSQGPDDWGSLIRPTLIREGVGPS